MGNFMKFWERMIEHRLRKETHISKNQFSFMSRRSTMEVIYLLWNLMKKYRSRERDLHMVFIDLEKAYDRVLREILWKVLEKKKGISCHIYLSYQRYV